SDLVNLVRGKNVVRLSWDGETVAAFGPAQLTLGPAKVPLPPGAFLQATREGGTALVAAVVEALSGAHHVADLFAGAGTFTLPLSKNAAVHAVEGEENMLEALLAGWRQTQGLKPVTTEARDLFRRPLLPDELARYDALVLDPPRAGAEAQIAEIVRAQVPLLAMVSCNPLTFARDAKALSGAGYDIEWLRVVDQFRWSPHVELVARFLRQGSKANSKRL
ncbi:MAG TPA: class I SAM-dependent RNA methyltransferase, partial [Aliiroseovarius sp.]|nr:class I SAM-dependent RNA methyltransferase [Aliiroseovarius sp.]